MKAVLQPIRILVITLLINTVRCQDAFERDLLRLQQLAAYGAPNDSIPNYSRDVIHRDLSNPSMSSVSVQYHMTDDAENEEYDRAGRGRIRKVYRIKNPFQRQLEDDGRQQESQPAPQPVPQDSDGGASNQYAAMQYSLPPEEFLRQMRAESQFYQQQQQTQVSTPAPNLGYTVTPQPQYQYSTIAASGYDHNSPQANQIPQIESKVSQPQDYRPVANSYQYGNANSYVESVQSTQSPLQSYVSTSNNQYVGTPASPFVSSSSPIYLSSPANVQFISSSIPNVPSGTPDYSNKLTSTIGSNSYNIYDTQDKKMQIDHYDNSANGMRYPSNIQQHFYNDYPNSTPSPSSTPYPDPVRDSWQNNINSNGLSKSLQEYPQFQKYYYRNQQDSRPDQSSDNINGDTHRIGNVPAANNVYLNFVQPDYQALSNIRSRTRDAEHETGQPDYYSHGEYGWKLGEKRPIVNQNGFSSASATFPRYQPYSSQPEGVAVSQMSFHMDTGKQHGYEHISKSSPETSDPQEFAKAAAKAHENMKRQQYYNNEYLQTYNTNNPVSSSTSGNHYYSNSNDKQRSKLFADTSSSNQFQYNNAQTDLITASPYYFSNSRENPYEEKLKQPFDHDKALKNIVPIDVSNVVPESQQKVPQNSDSNTRYNVLNYNKDQVEQNIKQNFKSITDSYYQDKNSVYSLNIKPRPEENTPSDGFKFLETGQYFVKQSSPEQYYGSFSDNKRYSDSSSSSANYISQQSNSYPDNLHSSANIQQQGLQRPQSQGATDLASIFKLNDIPYRLTQNLSPETFRLNNGNYEPVGLPTPLPVRLNQNVGSHQLDVASSILNKLLLNKQQPLNLNRPEIDPALLSNINGFKIANPYNVDLKLVSDMLKGKQVIDDSHMLGLREPFNKPAPLKLDISQLQQLLLKNDNSAGLTQLDGLSAYSSPYLDIYGSGRYPYQGVKYSRSQEEEETVIPIADGSNNHPIGAVMEQDDPVNAREVTSEGELTGQEEDLSSITFDRNKHTYSQTNRPEKHRHPNSLPSNRHPFPRKYPKTEEPYSLLKPPLHFSRSRSGYKVDKHGRRRRVRRPRVFRTLKNDSSYEGEDDSDSVSFLLKPPPQIADAKSDKVVDEANSYSEK